MTFLTKLSLNFGGFWSSFLSLLFDAFLIGLPIAFLRILWELWLIHVFLKYKASLKWVVLEVKSPPDMTIHPKAMEQVFANLWSIVRFKKKFWDAYVKGVFQEWVVFEYVLKNGKIHFYIRTPVQFRSLIESKLYAQYPDIEITEVEDYMKYLPDYLPHPDYGMFGTEYQFLKPPAYPILTYSYFFESRDRESADPLASILEVFSQFPDSAFVALQYFVQPAKETDWKPEAEKIRDSLIGKSQPPPKPSLLKRLFGFLSQLIDAFQGKSTTAPSNSSSSNEVNVYRLSPGTLEVVKAIERKIAKFGFNVGIRVFYFDRKENFQKGLTGILLSLFNSVNSQNLNSIVINNDARTSYLPTLWQKTFLGKQRIRLKERRFYKRFIWGSFPYSPPLLNTEELATICRPPGNLVRTPLLEKKPIKTTEPPANLPI